ncbi:Ring finger protein [Pandoravirus salinus]|uniref:Ring finger protein n=1 Tax=Pandoravirus salinus TaxID=1349410 RepID=S4W0I4_9VIRU|nr:Ring domain [Pandoravirus salinus]AGO83887.1 Ring finger protein [Pandoravirus salinus]
MAHDGDDRVAALLRAALRWESGAPFASVPHVAIVGGRYMPIGALGSMPTHRSTRRIPRSAVGGGRRIYAPSWPSAYRMPAPPPSHNTRLAAGGRYTLGRFSTTSSAEGATSSDDDDDVGGDGADGRDRHPFRDVDGTSSADTSTSDTDDDNDTDGTSDDDDSQRDDSDDSDSQRTTSDSASSAGDSDGSDSPHLTRLLNDAVTRSLDEVCASGPRPRQVPVDLPVRRHCASVHGEGACAVCLDDFSDGDQVRSLPCAHAYHASCIDRWLVDHDACPCCRAPVMRQGPHDDAPTFAVVHPVDPAAMPEWMDDAIARVARA